MKKKILLVAMPGSIHVVRWIKQLHESNLDIHLFPSTGGIVIHPEMDGVTFHSPLLSWSRRIESKPQDMEKRWFANLISCSRRCFMSFFRAFQGRKHSADIEALEVKQFRGTGLVGASRPAVAQQMRLFLKEQVLERYLPNLRTRRLLEVIKDTQPDLVHSLEMQAAGSLTLGAKIGSPNSFPPWLVTNWGSDIFLFGRLQHHKALIQSVLQSCDYYSCECERDVGLAREYGFCGEVMPVFPNTGGFDLPKLEKLRSATQASNRRLIMLKGYQNWAGRALVGLRALSRCEDVLRGYEVCIYLASPDVEIAAELFSATTGVPVRIIPLGTPHNEILSLHASARISIGLSISDAISTSFLEALVMGAFPIQSCTACADEWIEHGVGGMIVPPEDPDIIELAIRTALTNDDLVDQASVNNWKLAENRLGGDLLKGKALDMYSVLLSLGRP